MLDRHEFRQLQTATTAYWIKEAGYRLDYETPIFGPPWSLPMEFPVYQWIVAKLSRGLGTGLEPTARGVSLAAFLAMLPAVYGLAGFFNLSPSRRLLVVTAVLSTPTYLFYARTFMIETTALTCAVWFLYALGRAVRDGCVGWAVGAAIFSTLAALAKVTTFLVFCPPAAVFAAWLWWPQWQRRGVALPAACKSAALAAGPVLVAISTGLWWVKRADAVKHSNPLSGFLTSSHLTSWNWGTLEQRVSARFWAENWTNISHFVFSEGALVLLLLGLTLIETPLRRVALWCVVFFLGGLLLFSNLFFHHDYYYCANAVFLTAAAGFVLAGIWDSTRLPVTARYLVPVLLLGSQWLVYYSEYGSYARRELPTPPAIASLIQETVPAEGVVLIYGWDWNCTIPYYAGRRALMIPNGREDEIAVLETILSQLPPRLISAMLIRSEPLANSPTFIRWRTDRFKLTPAPFATSADGDLYLPLSAVAPARARVAQREFPGVHLTSIAPIDPNAALLKEVPLPATDLSFLSPRPLRARSQFSFALGELGGQPLLNAHAPSELHFVPPAGARRIIAEFGLPAGAYTGGTSVTDGIGVEIFELGADNAYRSLFRRMIDPRNVAADRGTQRVELPDAGPFTGTLVFRFTPGPQNQITNDWAYWSAIEIR